MRGRETGSPEHRKAADYVADQFTRAGLEPAGIAGFMQPVTFRSRKIVEEKSSLALVRRGKETPVVLGDEATFSMRIDPAPQVEAPLVFAGHGLAIPELDHDDFAGLDVKGKVVVHLSGSPRNVPGALSAHYQSAAERWNALKARGAIGTITIPNPKAWTCRGSARRPTGSTPRWRWPMPAPTTPPARRCRSPSTRRGPRSCSRARATPWPRCSRSPTKARRLPHFPLPTSMKATVAVDSQAVESQNVVGVVKGSDPALADEYVVLSAHLDHVGVGAAINGDSIYNGAMDNASGIATLIESAKVVAAARPKRSVLFVAVTAEEKGLLGSRYFSLHPTVPKANLVANINMDMFLPLFPMKSVMVLGLDESELGDDIRAVAQGLGVSVQPDPEPQRNRFIRSDQYSFIREGVPALAMKVGYEDGSPEAKIAADWTRERYHGPGDDLAQPIDRTAAVLFTDLTGKLCVQVANRAARPEWKAESFFRRFVRPAATSPTTGQ